jgi:hypothetical protein
MQRFDRGRASAAVLILLSILGSFALILGADPAAVGQAPAQATALAWPVRLPLVVSRFDLRPARPTVPPTSPPVTPRPTSTHTPTPAPTTPLPPGTPGVPACSVTRGDAGGFRFSLDGGATIASNATRLAPLAYTWDLDVDPRDPNVILQLHERTLYRSADAGCTFQPLAQLSRSWTDVTRAPSRPDVLVLTSFLTDGPAGLAWSEDAGVTWHEEPLPEDALGFAIDPADPWHWAFVGRTPNLYVRPNRDVRWEARVIPGLPEPAGTVVTAAAAAPSRWGRWLVGTMTQGVVFTDDLGINWRPASEGFGGSVGEPAEPVIASVVAWLVFAPSDADVAYVVLNRVGRNQSQRAIYRTGDAAMTWQGRVVDGQPVGDRSAQLTGGTRVFVSPYDPNTALFAFGTYFNAYGTDLFRSTDGLQTLDVSHFDGFYEIETLAFGPPGSLVRYLGVSSDIPPR